MPEMQGFVLIVDDEEAVLESTSMILQNAGYAVDGATDGVEAIERLGSAHYDVAILDVRMPRGDGIWVVEHLPPKPPPPVIIMASAYEFGADMKNRLGDRVFTYLRKPVPPQDLIDAVGLAASRA